MGQLFGKHKCSGGEHPDPCVFCHTMAIAGVTAYGSIGDTAGANRCTELLESWREQPPEEADDTPKDGDPTYEEFRAWVRASRARGGDDDPGD